LELKTVVFLFRSSREEQEAEDFAVDHICRGSEHGDFIAILYGALGT
jgi:hypothetical protein